MAPIKAKKSEKFQTIGLIGRTRMQEHATFLRKLKKYLEKNKCNILWDEHLSCVYGEKNVETQKKILKKADIVISLGGDGTILKIVRDLPKRKNLYIYPVNLGNLGFLTETKKSDAVFTQLDEFFAGKYTVDERLLIRTTLYRKNLKLETHLALNDMVINQGNFARLISLHAEIDQRKMIRFKGDGLIIATPTGSTGHSLSAGGPIIHPKIDAFIFTPICPSELTVRPIVVPSNRQLSITIRTERRFKDNHIGLTIDGQIVIPVHYGDTIKVRRSSRKLRFIRKAPGASYYRLLRSKLNWGKKS
ncbi:NAD(+) kinase [Candidatus Peregrinibacteria bacterium]|jgi:NAD+ kinase|nr:NAD(+) kinase [Candidatus Peregrinibacteria bacterium]MBT4632335.1 NAD(+) kinase [Candidatus Peregrinibacteria bacterium]MBT5517131.1 NAD(+) kinase [Candidatus Peregrinibacteria bacterium]MBT5824041.1 NAD(+) kinase [Candidatus Peregrinibacteria bacterium]